MNEQPTALWLADELEDACAPKFIVNEAAAELRRLHDLCAEWEKKAETWLASPEAAKRLDGYRELAQALRKQRTWVGLTDQEIDNLWNQHEPRFDYYLFSCDIEAKLKEKNT